MTTHRTTALAALLASLLIAPAANSAAAEPDPAKIPAAVFFDPPEMSHPVLSPRGDAIAVLVRNKSGRRQLAIVDTADVHKVNLAAGYDNVDIAGVRWVDDTRLVYSITREHESAWEQRDEASGLFAVDRDGSGQRTLILPNWESRASQTSSMIAQHVLTPDYLMWRTLRDGSGDVIVVHVRGTTSGNEERNHTDVEDTSPLRLNTRDGHTHDAITGTVPHHVFQWMVDDKGTVLAALAQADGQSTLLVQDSPGHWQDRAHFSSYKPGAIPFSLDEVGPDGRVYVLKTYEGADALYRLDLKTGEPEAEPLVNTKGFDFDGYLIGDSRNHKVLGVRYKIDADGTAWLDPSLTALQAKVDALLPGLVNNISLAECACSSSVLVTTYSDRQPAAYFLYDRANEKLTAIGQSRPMIVARQMAATSFERIKARDGQDLPVYVTRPSGKGPWPTVVLVHGGPQVRGWDWDWDPESQFLASRGYLVVKPEYRGSEGYGDALFVSGFKQWGLKSQDDIADATTWAASKGLADPKRTCIAGASYGGYATLMGLVRYGDLYRCGVAWSAVADIDMMYDLWWSDFDDDWKGYGMPVMVGDRIKDAAQFAETSPLRQAARITHPLLLAHGSEDQRVPIEHAERLHAALQAAHAPVTWVYYKEEAHGWSKPETRVDFYEKMAAFLNANIGAGSAPQSVAATSPAP